jgi:hypothetical protein
MNAIELLALARQDFEAKLAMVEDDQWALPTPCTEWNVRPYRSATSPAAARSDEAPPQPTVMARRSRTGPSRST